MSTLSARQTVMLVVLFVVSSFTFIALDNNRTLDPLKSGLHDSLVPVTTPSTGSAAAAKAIPTWP